MAALTYTELLQAEKFIRALLHGSAGLHALVADRIYRRKAPSTTTYPCVVFFYYGGFDELYGGGARAYTDMRYVVKYIDKAPSTVEDGVDAGAALIDTALTDSATDHVFVCVREEPFDNEYELNNITYEERGGIYNLAIQGG